MVKEHDTHTHTHTCTQLTISPTDYLGNYMRILELTARTNVRRFFSGVNRLEWPVDIAKPTDVNAFYSPYINEISESV